MTKRTPIDAAAQAEVERFLMLVIHDLRSPLRQGLINGQLLERSAADTLDETSKRHLTGVLEANRVTNALLARLAEYCQAGSGLDRVLPVSAPVLLENAIRMAGTDLEISIVVEDLPDLLVPAPIQKVFFELLDNARKFRRGALTVRIGCHAEGSEYIFAVRDNGIGFESRYADVIWEPLQRLHGVGDYPGFGLGLSISQRIVNGLNGRIWAESVQGEGSTFHFSLPVEQKPRREESSGAAP